ncbi:MAG: LytTR family transcriptional regulator [Chitinophagaceae bacterium]|nr:LytTR family transcriptional regulator [Chitinophagaceae bacterium]
MECPKPNAYQLSEDYPGIKLIALLHEPYTEADIIQLLKYGCNNFILAKNIALIKEQLRLAIHKAEYNHNMREYITAWLYNTGCLVRMSYHLARLLRLFVRNRTRRDIQLLKGITGGQTEDGMRDLFDTLSDIGFTENIIRQGLSEPEPEPKLLQYFKDGTNKIFEKPDEIVMIRADDDYVNVYLQDGTISAPYLFTLTQLQKELKHTNLFRVSNSEMVNKLFVKGLYDRDVIKLRIDYKEKRQITLGNKYRPEFFKRMGLE